MGALSPEDAEPIGMLWELIRVFFADYLRLVERDASALLDLDRATFPRSPRVQREEGGMVARIPVRKGGDVVTVLVRIEPDLPLPARAAESMAGTFRALRVPYGAPILATLLSLRGGKPGVTLEAGPLTKLAGIELGRIFFTSFCLFGTNAESYLQRPEPLAWVLSALMGPTRRTVEEHGAICRDKIATAPLAPRHRALLRRGLETFSARPWKDSS